MLRFHFMTISFTIVSILHSMTANRCIKAHRSKGSLFLPFWEPTLAARGKQKKKREDEKQQKETKERPGKQEKEKKKTKEDKGMKKRKRE